jgi:hypothetical protein
MSSTPCQPETLLRAPTCDIQYCADCGMIHLMMGSMTLRLTTEHFQELAQDLIKGAWKLEKRNHPSSDFHSHNITTLHS